MSTNRLEVMWGKRILEHGFTSVPNTIVRNATRAGLTGREFQLVMIIMGYKHDETDPYPSQALLASHLGTSERNIRKVVASIEQKGLIYVSKRTDNKGKFRSNVYNFEPLIAKCLEVEKGEIVGEERPHAQAKRENVPLEQNVPEEGDQKVPVAPEQNVPTKTKKENNHKKSKQYQVLISETDIDRLEIPTIIKKRLATHRKRLMKDSIRLSDILFVWNKYQHDIGIMSFASVIESVLTKTPKRINNISLLLETSLNNYLKKTVPRESASQPQTKKEIIPSWLEEHDREVWEKYYSKLRRKKEDRAFSQSKVCT